MKSEEIMEEAVDLMEAAGDLTIRLSENEEVYDLHYIQAQLAKCSSYGERLADMLARLTQLKVATLRELDRAGNALEIQRAETEMDAHTDTLKPVTKRAAHVRLKCREHVDTRRAWKEADVVLREAKEDVSRRADTVKRLDSDLRLHQRIIEAKITAGAMGRPDLVGKPGYRGGETDVLPGDTERDTGEDVDLD